MTNLPIFMSGIIIVVIIGYFVIGDKGTEIYISENLNNTAQTKVERNENITIGAWLVRWNSGKGLDDAVTHMNTFSTLSPFSFEVTKQGNVTDVLRINSEGWQKVLKSAKTNSTTIIPSFLWMDIQAMTDILTNETKRTSLAKQIAETISKTHTDGADIDFEWMSPNIYPQFFLFLKDLKMQLSGKLLTCSIEARMPSQDVEKKKIIDSYHKEIGAVCDEVRIMAYDMRFVDMQLAQKEKAPYIPNADIRTVKTLLEYLSMQIPREKIVLGIALYGYEYEVKENATSTEYKLLWSFSPSYVKGLISKNNLVMKRSPAGESYVTYGGVKNAKPSQFYLSMQPFVVEQPNEKSKSYNVLWWSDVTSVQEKIELTKSLGLKGISLFRIDGDTDSELWKVLEKE